MVFVFLGIPHPVTLGRENTCMIQPTCEAPQLNQNWNLTKFSKHPYIKFRESLYADLM
jgi:hypothetical protein